MLNLFDPQQSFHYLGFTRVVNVNEAAGSPRLARLLYLHSSQLHLGYATLHKNDTREREKEGGNGRPGTELERST